MSARSQPRARNAARRILSSRGGLGDLRHKCAKYRVTRGEIDSPLDLHFEDGRLTLAVTSMDDHIVEWTVGSTLEFNAGNGSARQASGLSSGKH